MATPKTLTVQQTADLRPLQQSQKYRFPKTSGATLVGAVIQRAIRGSVKIANRKDGPCRS
jgi:hypothetical protein